MAVNTPNDFLRFSAYQIKDLITRKLSEDKNFTDQVYEGSNLAILIDIVSYMYQCLIYNLNASAAESMFADTQLYENISRLCTFIGYHPMGYKPATLRIQINKESIPTSKNQILQCTGIDTGMYDTNGKKIFFSTIFEPELEYMPISVSDNTNTNVRLLNGRWKFYDTIFTASGNGYETFILYGLQSDVVKEKYVANAQIEVFVRPVEDVKTGRYSNMRRWESDSNELFVQAYNINTAPNSKFNELYDSDEEVYSLYLNEEKTYEIKFGNGIIGKKLNKGDELYIMYLDTNGPDGYVDLTQLSAMTKAKLQHSPSFFGLTEEVYKGMFNPTVASLADETVEIGIDFDSLTRPTPEETPDQIRESAPSWFKSGNRLITKKDYEFFVKANQSSIFDGVIDVKCMNNWDYMTTFYRWLYNMGINPVEEVFYNQDDDSSDKRSRDPFRYLSKIRLIQHGYEFVDSADANNIYLWFAMSSKDSSMEKLKSDLNSQIMLIKTMTSETYPLQAVDVNFDLSFTPSQLYYDMLVANEGDVTDDLSCSYLEITIADNTLYSNVTIQNNVAKIIQNAFNEQHRKLGQPIEYAKILDDIYAINGVERVRTVYCPEGYPENAEYAEYKARACDGLSFASWSNTPVIDIGDDLQLNNVTRTLEPFQFPRLVGSIQNKIKVIKKSMNTTNPVKF